MDLFICLVYLQPIKTAMHGGIILETWGHIWYKLI